MRMLSQWGDLCFKALSQRIACAALASLIVGSLPVRGGEGTGQKRRITVRDTIEMTEFADRGYFLGGKPTFPVAIFSPDGKWFLIRLKKGNLERNVVEYRLLLYETSEVSHPSSGNVLITKSSSSNREAIQEVRWLDNQTITFLGEDNGELPQVYRTDVYSKRVVQLTHHPTAVVCYDVSRDGRQIIYEAAPAPRRIFAAEQERRKGIVITSQTLDELLNDRGERDDPRIDRELYVQRVDEKAVRVPSPDFLTEYLPLDLSPDGRFAVLAAYVSGIPNEWQKYEDKVLRPYIVEKRKPGTLSNVEQYMLVDVQKATMRPLLDAPKGWLDEGVAWFRDGRSVIVSGTFLPLDIQEQWEDRERRKHPFVVEVEILSGTIRAITGQGVCISHWDEKRQRIILEPGYGAAKGPSETFAKINNEWRQISTSAMEEAGVPTIEVSLEEDGNTPPMIFAKDRATGKKSLLVDLNPQLHDLELGAVETMEWKATDGHEVKGGLYFPPRYQPGKRCPLVIQTHGYDEDRFWMNGPWNSAFAAQPLAAQGVMVLQVGDSTKTGEERKFANTPGEGPRRMAAFEGAIDELDRRGLIDRNRVGIIGFSRTAFHVAFTLTHSKYQFRAATLADGFDAGYLGYLLWRVADYEGVNGGVPVGVGLQSWFEKSPAFRIEAVSTPVRLEYYGPDSFLGGWQWFSLLFSLGKPVDFIWIPRGTHLLVKPWERLTSQEGNVEWFRFWLCGEETETCESEDFEACARWRELAALQASKGR
jgi:dipeptidyl aminopeptidase/acylaminoacyl peptidase